MSKLIYIPKPAAVYLGYGLLYNFYAVIDIRNLANTGWHVITKNEIIALMETIDPVPYYSLYDCSNAFNEAGYAHWEHASGTNITGITLVGNGMRDTYGVEWEYYDFYKCGYYWTSTMEGDWPVHFISQNQLNTQLMYCQIDYHTRGQGVRLIKDSTSLSEGEHGSYTGNDGQVYDTVCYAGKEIVTKNLSEKKYRNGDSIQLVTDDAAWAALSTGAYCYCNGALLNT